MFKRILIGSGVFLVFTVLVLIGLLAWRDRVIQQRSGAALARVETALAEAPPQAALALINARPPAGDEDAANRRWFAAEVEACARLGLVARLQTLHSQDRALTLANEDAALLLARSFLHGGDEGKGLAIATDWRARSKRPEVWFAFEVDAALLNGRRDEAWRELTANKFAGPGDSLRLTRLALLTASTNVGEAWNRLADAYEANPRDLDVRSFRGQILESLGSNQLARVEYVAAHVAEPGNFLMRDQLAEFYRRHGNYLSALETWRPALTNGAPAYLRVKARFWSRVARPVPLPAAERAADPAGELAGLLAGTATNRFWSEDEFELLGGRSVLERGRQEVFWLRVLDRLAERREDAALELLRTNPFRGRDFDRLLDRVLYAVLSWRKHGRLEAHGVEFPPTGDVADRHSFLVEVDKYFRMERAARRAVELPAELRSVLDHPSAPALVVLTAGWLRAGLELERQGSDAGWPAGPPAWVPYALTRATRMLAGAEAALEFAARQPASPELSLLVGELELAEGQAEAGWRTLAPLGSAAGAVGYRAAWLLANSLLERGEHARLVAVVEGQPALGNAVVGQELLARSALWLGETNRAETIYTAIVADSVAAKAYLARLAFARQDWRRARELTEALLLLMPDELALRRNLAAIAAAEKAKQ